MHFVSDNTRCGQYWWCKLGRFQLPHSYKLFFQVRVLQEISVKVVTVWNCCVC